MDAPKTDEKSNKLAHPMRSSGNRKQFSSFILFLSVIIIVNLCPFQSDLEHLEQKAQSLTVRKQLNPFQQAASVNYIGYLERCVDFVKLMFTSPVRISGRTTRSMQADAKVLGKMAKMWYIKKKIKKLSKKLKKHTIAVPVFTAIPIYEHSYYPQPHVTHVTHGGMHHAAAASSYSPAVSTVPAPSSTGAQSQQMIASASNNHQQMAAYRMPGHYHHHSMYHPMQTANAHQIINSYPPSPPLYVDDAGGLYGHYGNAYSRYDGGYHLW